MDAICLILWAGIRTWHDVANLAILLWNKKILLLCWGILRGSSLLQCATNKDGAVTVTWYSGQASKGASNSTQHDTGHLFQAHTGHVTQNGKASSWTTMMSCDEDSSWIKLLIRDDVKCLHSSFVYLAAFLICLGGRNLLESWAAEW